MKKIRIAQIGTGHDHAGVTFAALRRLTDIFEVVGYAEVPEDDLDYIASKEHHKNDLWAYEGAKKYTVDELLSMRDLDAVAVETYDLNLVKYAQMAVNKGLHVQMDKAAGESAEEFEKLLKTVKEKKLVFNMGYMYRFNPLIRQAFERVRKGELGRVYSVEAEMNCYYGKDKREWLEKFQGGMMQYLGCHLIDLIVRLQGVPEEIIPYNYATGADGVQTKDVAFALLKYPNGISTVKSSMIDAGGYVRRHLTIHGEKGTIRICPLEKGEGGVSNISTKMVDYLPSDGWHGLGRTTNSGVFDRYEGMLSAFAEMIRGERGLEVDLETEARVHRCLLTACGIPYEYKTKIE